MAVFEKTELLQTGAHPSAFGSCLESKSGNGNSLLCGQTFPRLDVLGGRVSVMLWNRGSVGTGGRGGNEAPTMQEVRAIPKNQKFV